jgi:hypothetical protein
MFSHNSDRMLSSQCIGVQILYFYGYKDMVYRKEIIYQSCQGNTF